MLEIQLMANGVAPLSWERNFSNERGICGTCNTVRAVAAVVKWIDGSLDTHVLDGLSHQAATRLR